MARMIFYFAVVTALAAPAAAQSGRIYGVATDESSAVLPAVEVRATMKDGVGETTRSVLTDRKGSYDLGTLSPGPWTVTMSLPGFETASHRVIVQNGDSLEWNPTLQLGMIQETISITSGANEAPQRVETPAPPSAAVAPAPGPAGPSIVRVGGSIKPPRKLVNVVPVYPADAVAQGISGVVILHAVIGPDGFVRDITAARSPNEALTIAATGAFNGWRFSPTLLNGAPVATRITATFNFQQQF